MNPEIYTILNDMTHRTPKDPVIATSDKNIYLSIQASRLQVLLAEETEKFAKDAEKTTTENINMQRTITDLTRKLYLLTIALFFIALLQVILPFFQHPPEINCQMQKKENYRQLNKETNPVPQTHTAPTSKKEVHK
jgi:hypothetical protein